MKMAESCMTGYSLKVPVDTNNWPSFKFLMNSDHLGFFSFCPQPV